MSRKKKREKKTARMLFVEHHVIQDDGVVFAGVWVQGPDMEGDLDYAYLPGFENELDAATWKMNDVIEEYKDKPLPADMLERVASGGYLNAWGPVQETEDYGSIPELEKHILAKKGLQA